LPQLWLEKPEIKKNLLWVCIHYPEEVNEIKPLLKEEVLIADHSSHLPEISAGIGTLTSVWLPRLHRAGPSASLDKSTYFLFIIALGNEFCGLYHTDTGCVKELTTWGGRFFVDAGIFPFYPRRRWRIPRRLQKKVPARCLRWHKFSLAMA